jgi:hypothetical protein
MGVSILIASVAIAATPFADRETIRGFTPEGSKTELDWETKFKAIPDPSRTSTRVSLATVRS